MEFYICPIEMLIIGYFTDEHMISTSMSRMREEAKIQAETKRKEETVLSAYESPDSSSISSYKVPVASTTTEDSLLCIDPTVTSAGFYIHSFFFPFKKLIISIDYSKITCQNVNYMPQFQKSSYSQRPSRQG